MCYKCKIGLVHGNEKSPKIKVTGSPVQIPNLGDPRMDKDTLLSSFGKWVASLNNNCKIIDNWQNMTNLDRYVKKLDTFVFSS